MSISELKAIANEKMEGRTKELLPVFLVYILLSVATTVVDEKVYRGGGTVVGLIINGPIALGMAMIAFHILDEREVQLKDLFSGFEMNFGTAFVLHLTNSLFTALWTLLFIVPGIMKYYSYSMSFYILADNPHMKASEARNASIELMKGNRWGLFLLDLSYLGWIILSALLLGIPLLYIGPRIEAAKAAFYRSISGQTVEGGKSEYVDSESSEYYDSFSGQE